MKVGTQLGQAQNGTSNVAVSLYSPAEGTKADVETINIASVTSAATTFSLYHDADGTTYSTTTALAYKTPISGYEHILIEFDNLLYMDNALGNIAIEGSTTACITVTAYGKETKR